MLLREQVFANLHQLTVRFVHVQHKRSYNPGLATMFVRAPAQQSVDALERRKVVTATRLMMLNPSIIVTQAVKGMLPKNLLRPNWLRRPGLC